MEINNYLLSMWHILNEPLIQIHNSQISIMSILLSILVIFFTFVIAKYSGNILSKTLVNKGVDYSVRNSIEKFTRYTIIVLGIVFALDNLGVSLSSIAALSAVLMVGIGFGLQNITQNFISGIVVLIERPIKLGDIIRVGSTSGKIIDIRVRSTIVRTRDDVTIIVPNSKFLSEEVFNESYTGQQIRQHIRIGVAYGSDVAHVKELLCQAAVNHPKVLPDPGPRAIFLDFGDSALVFDLRFWCSEIWDMDQTTSDIRCEIDKVFKSHNIIIPFPQSDVYLHGK